MKNQYPTLELACDALKSIPKKGVDTIIRLSTSIKNHSLSINVKSFTNVLKVNSEIQVYKLGNS